MELLGSCDLWTGRTACQHISALAADYERLAELEARPFAAQQRPMAAHLKTVDYPPLRWERWLQTVPPSADSSAPLLGLATVPTSVAFLPHLEQRIHRASSLQLLHYVASASSRIRPLREPLQIHQPGGVGKSLRGARTGLEAL